MRRSKFSLSHYKLTTMDMGHLIPLTWYETLPGDTVQHSTSCLIRVSPLLSPVMHPVRVRIHHWFVPLRLIHDNWETFITGGPDGMDQTELPYIEATSIQQGSLADQLGVPPGDYSGNPIRYSAFPTRAYCLINNEHYRDQDLIEEYDISKGDGLDTTTHNELIRCAWEKDYFTTARPWEQKGFDVTIPIGDTAPVTGTGTPTFNFVGDEFPSGRALKNTNPNDQTIEASGDDHADETNLQWNNPALYADLSSATGIDINDLRLALSIQRYQEARAQYGSRYVEYLRYLGVRSSDARLQNPEYLGGGRQVIQFSEVLQTAPSGEPTPFADNVVGALKGHGIAAMRTNRHRRFFEEHGIVMTLMSVVPKAIYTSALKRGFSRKVKEDYFQKELQFIGEQEIPNKEIQANHSSPEATFGYQARYDEYRTCPSSIAGEFRNELNYWHYGREFEGDIALNQSFIDAVPTKRVNAAPENDVLYVMANHSVQARRMLTKQAYSKTF